MSSAATAAPPSALASEAALANLELAVTRRLDGLLHGDYRGLIPGPGTELGATREYQPGDDVRRMDWSVLARTNVPHVRENIADRELETWAVVDQSASLDFGTADWEKRDLAVAAVAAVGFLSTRRGNRLGLLTARDGEIGRLPARPGRSAMLATLRRLTGTPRAEAGDHADASLATALSELPRLAPRRGLVVVVSDFLADGWERPLRALAHRHDTLAVEVVDPRELELPSVGMLTLVDPETGRHLEVQTARARVRQRYAEAAEAQRAEVAAAVRRAGADRLRLRTDEDWITDIVGYVASRRRRVAAGRLAR
jgi:uncharacterized protein (DUF58 family)